MTVSYLSERTRKLFQLLLKQNGILTIKEAAEALEVSSRTMYNELDQDQSNLLFIF